jgi:hypothetical protein
MLRHLRGRGELPERSGHTGSHCRALRQPRVWKSYGRWLGRLPWCYGWLASWSPNRPMSPPRSGRCWSCSGAGSAASQGGVVRPLRVLSAYGCGRTCAGPAHRSAGQPQRVLPAGRGRARLRCGGRAAMTVARSPSARGPPVRLPQKNAADPGPVMLLLVCQFESGVELCGSRYRHGQQPERRSGPSGL